MIRIIGALLMDQTEAWRNGRLYVDMEEYLAFVAARGELASPLLLECDESRNHHMGEAAEKGVKVQAA